MIKELRDFGEKKRIDIAKGRLVHDALIIDSLDVMISISKDGRFKTIYSVERETIIEGNGLPLRFLIICVGALRI